MPRPALAFLVAGLLLAMLGSALAHTGYEHVLGSITGIDEHQMEVKTRAATVVLILNADTAYLRRGRVVAHVDLAVGSRVVVDARREKGVLVAKEVRFVVDAE